MCRLSISSSEVDVMQLKKIGYALFVGVAAGICILPTIAMLWRTAEPVGNEQLASMPELLNDEGGFNTQILNDFSDYFSDHFGFRHEMITLNDKAAGLLFKTLPSSSVLLGKEHWLFYSSTIDDYTGTALFTVRQSYAAAHELQLMQEYCRQNSVNFYFTIAPNKNSLYGSQMPARYLAAQTRNAQLLAQQMRQQGVQYVDLFQVLSGSEEQLYYRLDSHWNMRGAQLVAQALLKEIRKTNVDFDTIRADTLQSHTGDLYEMVYPAGKETEQDISFNFDYFYDEKFHSADDITIHTENASKDGRIFVYRDSFGINLHAFIAQDYGKACFSRNMPYRLTAALDEQPDTILVEIVERNLSWLIERAPEFPAPVRADVQAEDTGDSITSTSTDGRLEGYL